jgi:hypothetical protein
VIYKSYGVALHICTTRIQTELMCSQHDMPLGYALRDNKRLGLAVGDYAQACLYRHKQANTNDIFPWLHAWNDLGSISQRTLLIMLPFAKKHMIDQCAYMDAIQDRIWTVCYNEEKHSSSRFDTFLSVKKITVSIRELHLCSPDTCKPEESRKKCHSSFKN